MRTLIGFLFMPITLPYKIITWGSDKSAERLRNKQVGKVVIVTWVCYWLGYTWIATGTFLGIVAGIATLILALALSGGIGWFKFLLVTILFGFIVLLFISIITNPKYQ